MRVVFLDADFLGERLFFAALFFGPVLLAPFFDGTLAPDSRASDNPMATACLGLVTFFPLRPLRSLPRFISCIARSTLSCDFLEYFAIWHALPLSCIKFGPGMVNGEREETGDRRQERGDRRQETEIYSLLTIHY